MPRPEPQSAADILDRLRELVEDDGRTTTAIAEAAAMARSQLAGYLTGRRRPTIDALLQVLAALDPPRTLADLDS
jgi:transcriptional regulator with XRE-family HTH domain